MLGTPLTTGHRTKGASPRPRSVTTRLEPQTVVGRVDLRIFHGSDTPLHRLAISLEFGAEIEPLDTWELSR